MARAATWRSLSQQYCGQDGKVWCVCLDEELEDQIGEYVGEGVAVSAVPKDLSARLSQAISRGVTRLRQRGRKGVVLCGPHIRATVRRLLGPAEAEAVLAYNEIDNQIVESIGNVGGES